MTAKIISGSEISADIRSELKARVTRLKAQGKTPFLGVVLVGEDPGSLSYVRSKEKGCEEIGMRETTIRLPADAPESRVIQEVDRLNKDKEVDGILVQTPLPKHVDTEKVLYFISPEKDVDGFHPVNMGKLLRGQSCFIPCTPHGIQEMLMRTGNDPSGKHVVICGRSNLVGKPLAALLVQKTAGANAVVTVVHTGTAHIQYFSRQADIVVAAMGSPLFIKADMIKEGAVVIDVGMNRIEDKSREKGYRFVGDVDFEKVKEKASAITPVPGGVGLMTVTMLLQNTIEAAEKTAGIRQ
ncbi:MAG: bifunctional 5,10-methylene-tetrahydrofolate dehydrogenase/5,10-methylene-tetrahydrofolate cyclohydrolase [Dehalococcoidia bacterium]|nr:bifunctional 5,10-methylene-tetrahydrofolate dehydrogenase/5,10-methylene-tetrahydrofolate cyclohydrolase [Dehalococcoidia bacterium]